MLVTESGICPDDGGILVTIEGDLRPGTIFADKYEILSVLGRGGMSVVYKARHKYMNRIVAVKLLLEHLVADAVATARFQQESQAASSLSHQNIVNVHDFGLTSTGQAYFVMDCLEGDSLEDCVLGRGPMDVRRAIEIFRQVCEGLQHAHKKGIIHRDLKPSNIVLIQEEDGSESAKIVDFGIAKMRPNDIAGKPSVRLTQTGEVFGSPLYMSPEQCQGYALDVRSDIYSLGCLMYETLSGVTPFAADSFLNMALLHVHQQPPPFSERCPEAEIPLAIEEVVMKCLAKETANRYDSVDQVRQKLLDAGLVSGLPGLKPGAVTAPKITGAEAKSPLRQTWESMKAVIDPSPSSPSKDKGVSFARRALFGSIVLGLVTVIGVSFLWPGPEGDRGTPYDKFVWQLEIATADKLAKNFQAYELANRLLFDAKHHARTFGDSQARLKVTVDHQADLYHMWNKFAEEEAANQESVELVRAQIEREVAVIKQQLAAAQNAKDTGTQKTLDQLHAQANAVKILISAKRLASRGMYDEQESLLKLAIDTFEELGLGRSEQVADFNLAMADCLVSQQRMSEVRPLLEQSVEIRKQTSSSLNSSKSALKEYIRAELRLGQFDRDQSDFDSSHAELKDALDKAQANFSKEDPAFVTLCRNSFNDLESQISRVNAKNHRK